MTNNAFVTAGTLSLIRMLCTGNREPDKLLTKNSMSLITLTILKPELSRGSMQIKISLAFSYSKEIYYIKLFIFTHF